MFNSVLKLLRVVMASNMLFKRTNMLSSSCFLPSTLNSAWGSTLFYNLGGCPPGINSTTYLFMGKSSMINISSRYSTGICSLKSLGEDRTLIWYRSEKRQDVMNIFVEDQLDVASKNLFGMYSHEIDSQLPSLISLFIFVWSISEANPKNNWMRGKQACLGGSHNGN